jgi:hypothetical protein
LLTLTTSALADQSTLKFDTAKLCQWQHDNNSMEVDECKTLEDEAQAKLPELEGKADAKRKEDCTTEANNFSVDSGYASYTLYAGCLKDGPGSL